VTAPGDNQPTWTIGQGPVLLWGDHVLPVPILPGWPDAEAAYDALVAAVRDAQHLPAALNIIARIQAEIASYEDVLDDPYDCAQFATFVVSLLADHVALLALAETRPQ
jgi:hypothetical protein